MTIELVRLLLGEAPLGYEMLEYVIAGIIALFVIKVVLEMFYFVLNLVRFK